MSEALSLRLRTTIQGVVQGVGFRPFVYRLARELGLTGWVRNTGRGVTIEAEGAEERLREFQLRLEAERPPHAVFYAREAHYLEPIGYEEFRILPSDRPGAGENSAWVLPDIASCPLCLQEVFDPSNRRYLYPFTNCTHCGPRYTIIEALPYDRPNTSMKAFEMCPACRAEYEDPADRRFHAQPNACPVCGPHAALWDGHGELLAERSQAVEAAAAALREGRIVAVKGLGGFHLMVRADAAEAVERLRRRKRREAKPFALMFPTLESVRRVCFLDEVEAQSLTSPAAPIVLLRKLEEPDAALAPAESVAPGNRFLGVMLPYTPLHHILLRRFGAPVVATSGNLSDEPICIDEREALERLGGVADLFLVHNRPIVRHADDSIVRVIHGRETVFRRARGFAPMPILIPGETPPLLAVGAHVKNSVAVARGNQVFLSQHIGDLETAAARRVMRVVSEDLQKLLDVQPQLVACDAHPDYGSTIYAGELGLPLFTVQHHVAHMLACMAENQLRPPCAGVVWDGSGMGSDGTIWGGEFLLLTEKAVYRAGHFRMFPLPGVQRAFRDPRRSALGVLYELYGEEAFALGEVGFLSKLSPNELQIVRQLLRSGRNVARTSSVGRLFDAAAALLGVADKNQFEGQAAVALEMLFDPGEEQDDYPFKLLDGPARRISMLSRPDPDLCIKEEASIPGFVVDWGPCVKGMLYDMRRLLGAWRISAKFHNTLVQVILAAARRLGQNRVILSGGCFQNHYLIKSAVTKLQAEGFRPFWHQRVPPNDGGIPLGQAAWLSIGPVS